ncbi:hypothetical protein GCM10011584_00810 [Nocardioides phosphati]|uniref:Uncharacterized protein n=1 Tax=Nocardioides phosphati TaxID=1867775 RepID=A0ABQ2N4C2_9ACTN|nr:hypothetical protein [Nocardioides phosphati]GGO84086.1 hypothetical protein GCM10011584_00810 [Nocardioides phosphati]
MRRSLLRIPLALTAAAGLVSTALVGGTADAGAPDGVAAIRAATARFHDPQVAIDAGYIPTDVCVEAPGLGVMGQHWINPSLVGSIDLRHPAILLYQPGTDGPELVAVEYFQPDADQDLSTDGDRPSLLGHPFDGPMLGHEPGMPIHYDLHAWVWQHNPAGTFAQFNPRGSC